MDKIPFTPKEYKTWQSDAVKTGHEEGEGHGLDKIKNFNLDTTLPDEYNKLSESIRNEIDLAVITLESIKASGGITEENKSKAFNAQCTLDKYR